MDLVGIASICILVAGLPVNLVMISYLKKKSPSTQTPLDFILIDTIASNIMSNCFNNFIVFLNLTFYPMKYQSAVILSFVGNITASWTIASVLTMLGFKYCFICYSHVMMEKPDSSVRLGSILIKLLLCYIATILDHYGPIQKTNSTFHLLSPDIEK